MTPRLFAISGPLRDSIFALPGGEIPVGRDPANLVSIPDPALSRRHCLLLNDDHGYRIRDLESRNGTFVNGVPVKESPLRHGDQISIGDSVLLLQLQEETAHDTPDRVEFDESSAAQATAQYRPQDVLYLQPDRIQRELPPNSSLARNLNALLKISRVVHAIRDLDQLQAQILSLIFEIIPAERGAILLTGSGEGFASIYGRHRTASITSPVRVSRTIARRVLDQGLAILGADVQGSGNGLGEVESIVASNVRSLLCVPLNVFQKVIGCIYLDTTNSPARFDEDHLQLVAAIADICAFALDMALNLQWLEQENLRLTQEIDLEHNMIGESARMKEVYQFLSRVAPADSTVLLRGESGTGKELVARAIHRNSPRAGKPFIAINCARYSRGPGGERTVRPRKRRVHRRHRPEKRPHRSWPTAASYSSTKSANSRRRLQVKLLRVLQERELERVGGVRSIPVNIRVVAATNHDLEAAVERGRFRHDLYYRLNVLALVLPPLRERREDIPLLAEYFVRKFCQKSRLQNPAHLSRGDGVPGELRLARQRARTGERHGTRRSSGSDRADPDRRSPRVVAGERPAERGDRGQISHGGERAEEAADQPGPGRSPGELHRGRPNPGDSSQLPASPGPQSGDEGIVAHIQSPGKRRRTGRRLREGGARVAPRGPDILPAIALPDADGGRWRGRSRQPAQSSGPARCARLLSP